MLDAITQNLRYAWRSLRRRPGLVVAIALTLGLGLGANAAMFGIVDRLLLQSPPHVRDPASVNRVYLGWHLASGAVCRCEEGGREDARASMSYPRFRDLTAWTTAFAQTAAFGGDLLPVGSGQATRQLMVVGVSATFFSFFDAPPVIGRYFTVEEDSPPRGTAVAVLSYAYWRSQYGGRSDVLGMPLQVGRVPYTVIGVAPENFVGIGDAGGQDWVPVRDAVAPSVFVPLTTFRATAVWFGGPYGYATNYFEDWLEMIVRRRPGVSPATASGSLTAAFQRSYLAGRSEAAAHDYNEWKSQLPPIEVARPRATAGPLLAERGPLESATARVAMWVAGVAAVVLLIACANVTNLLLASARERRGEIALRLALGMSRRRLVGQLLTECLLLAGIGGVAALVVARFGGAILTSMFLPGNTGPGLLGQPRTLLFAAAGTVLAGVATGLVPALQARRTDVIGALKSGSRGGSPDRSRTRALLLLVQGALSAALLAGAGLFVRSVEHAHAVPLGFDVDPILEVTVDPRGSTLDSAARRVLAQRLIDAAKAVPGVADAARVLVTPFTGWAMTDLFVPGLGLIDRQRDFKLQAVSPEYFHTVGTRILRGRGFTRADGAHAPRVAVVSEAMAHALWPGEDAIGKSIQVDSDTMPYTTVVGIAENTKQESLSDDRQLHYYLLFEQLGWDGGTVQLLIRTRADARVYQATVGRVLQSLMPGTAYANLMPMRELLDPQVRSWELGATMFLAFGILALLVAAFGLYSVIAYDVARRTHELGVRIALGARGLDVVRTVAADSALFAAVGVLLGGAIALAAGPLIAPLLFAESPRDPVVFGAVAVVLAAAVTAATIAPVLRASRVDPGTALRTE